MSSSTKNESGVYLMTLTTKLTDPESLKCSIKLNHSAITGQQGAESVSAFKLSEFQTKKQLSRARLKRRTISQKIITKWDS